LKRLVIKKDVFFDNTLTFDERVVTARCWVGRGILMVCRLSVRLSVCDVGGFWSHRLEFFDNNFTLSYSLFENTFSTRGRI